MPNNVYLVETWEPGVGVGVDERKNVYYVQMGPEYDKKDVQEVAVREAGGDFVRVTVLNGFKLTREGWKLDRPVRETYPLYDKH